MKPIAKIGYLAAACALLVTTFAIIGPRTVHAIVATLVQVANTAADPVPTYAADNPALRPFAAFCSGSTGTGGQCIITVPSGERLIIESVTGYIEQPTGTVPENILLTLITGSKQVNIPMVPILTATNAQTGNGYDDWYLDLKYVRLYADPGTDIRITPGEQYFDEPNGTGFTITGYTVVVQ